MNMAQGMIYGEYENEYGRNYVNPSDRMYVHASVYLPSSEIDARTGLLRPDGPRRGRTQAKKLEYRRLDKEYAQLDAALKRRKEHPGVRVSLRSAILASVALVFILCAILLFQQGNLTAKQMSLSRLSKEIDRIVKDNEKLADQIAEASDSAVICYAAARNLDMIPGEVAPAIYLSAMNTRPLKMNETLMETQAIYDQALADAHNDNPFSQPSPSDVEATAIPMIASAEVR